MPATQRLETTTRTTTTWSADLAHTQASFAIRHLMIATVRGRIPVRSVLIERDENDLARSRIEAELDPAGIDTGTPDRDGHLRSPDFFDVAEHPTMRFASTRIERSGDGFRVHGDLTIRGATRPVVLDVEVLGEIRDDDGKRRIAASATTTFDRSEWGLTWNMAIEAGGVLVGDKVKVQLDVEVVEQ